MRTCHIVLKLTGTHPFESLFPSEFRAYFIIRDPRTKPKTYTWIRRHVGLERENALISLECRFVCSSCELKTRLREKSDEIVTLTKEELVYEWMGLEGLTTGEM